MEGDRCPLILLDLVSRCNRSVPHQEIISAAFDILINLSRYDKAREVMGGGKCASVLSKTVCDVSAMYREKRTPEIFGKGCALLWAMSEQEEVKKVEWIYEKYFVEDKYS